MLLLAVFLAVGTILVFVLAAAIGAMRGTGDLGVWLEQLAEGGVDDPVTFAVTNLGIIVLIPVAVAALAIAHRLPVGAVASVALRVRWAWFGRCLLVLTPLWLGYLLVAWLVAGRPVGARPAQAGLLALLVLLLTPLQSAAEEVAFRGWALLSLGSWFANSRVALIVPTVVSVPLFAAAHGSPDPWILLDLGSFALAATLMTWRTGGLEAAIALHLINNVLAMQMSLLVGGFTEGFVDQAATGSATQAGISLVMNAVALALVWRLASRHHLPWRYRPSPAAPLTPAQPFGQPF